MDAQKNKSKKQLSLLAVLLMIGLIPLVVTVLVSNIIAVRQLKVNYQEGIYDKLEITAKAMVEYYGWDAANLGGVDYEHDYVDSYEDQNIDTSLYLDGKIFITSIQDAGGNRIEGEALDPAIREKIAGGEDYVGKGMALGGKKYYVCYSPMFNESGEMFGVAFAGETEEEINKNVALITGGLVLVAVVTSLIFGAIIVVVAIAICKNLKKIVDVTEELAQGNLNADFTVSTIIKELQSLADAAGDLKGNIGNIISTVVAKVGNLDTSMVRIADGVSCSNQATEGVVSAVDEMARGSVEMAESVQNTAVKMQEMGDDIGAITSLAKSAMGTTLEVTKESQAAKEQLAKLMEANADTVQISHDVMTGIHDSAEAVENIRKAAEVISEIASQTALLSLNASIEAARAGEAGRGFAVVAGEISNLANQSDASTQEIQKVVEEIIAFSEHNVKLAGNIKTAVDNEGAVLAKVSKSFDLVNQKVQSTEKSVQEITEKAGDLNAAKQVVLDEVSALSAISEQSAASCEQTNATMEELGATVATINQETQDTQTASKDLKEAVAYFKL